MPDLHIKFLSSDFVNHFAYRFLYPLSSILVPHSLTLSTPTLQHNHTSLPHNLVTPQKKKYPPLFLSSCSFRFLSTLLSSSFLPSSISSYAICRKVFLYFCAHAHFNASPAFSSIFSTFFIHNFSIFSFVSFTTLVSASRTTLAPLLFHFPLLPLPSFC